MTVSALAGHSEGNLEKKYGRQFPGITLYAAGRVMSIRDVLVHILHVRIGRIGCTGASIIRTIAIRARERVQPRIFVEASARIIAGWLNPRIKAHDSDTAIDWDPPW